MRDPVFRPIQDQGPCVLVNGYTFKNLEGLDGPFTWSSALGIGAKAETAQEGDPAYEGFTISGPPHSKPLVAVYFSDMSAPVTISGGNGTNNWFSAGLIPDKDGKAVLRISDPGWHEIFEGTTGSHFNVVGFSVPDNNNPLLLLGISLVALLGTKMVLKRWSIRSM